MHCRFAIWYLSVNGLIVDIRYMAREAQVLSLESKTPKRLRST